MFSTCAKWVQVVNDEMMVATHTVGVSEIYSTSDGFGVSLTWSAELFTYNQGSKLNRQNPCQVCDGLL